MTIYGRTTVPGLPSFSDHWWPIMGNTICDSPDSKTREILDESEFVGNWMRVSDVETTVIKVDVKMKMSATTQFSGD